MFLLSGLIIVLQRETCLPSRNSFLSVITNFSFFSGDQEECEGMGGQMKAAQLLLI